MALTFIVGSAGAGKSHLLYKRMTNEASRYENRNDEYIALVPEQYSMEAQREILLASKKHGSFNIEVVSFSRLAINVFEEQSMTSLNIMDDLGKTLIMRKILEDCRKNLIYYHNKASMPGFAQKAKTLVTEFKQYNYDLKDIENMIDAAKEHNVLRNKLVDMKTISQAFDNYIDEKMITTEDVLHKFCDIVSMSEKIKNSHIYIDSFTGFTPIQYKVLEQLIRFAKSVTVAITLPEEEVNFNGYSEQDLFYLSKETIVKLKELAIRNSVETGDMIVVCPGQRPYRIAENDELCHIEKYIFRNKGIPKYNKQCNSLEVHVASNPRDEARFIANEISKLMITGKYKYKDIAVIVGSMEGYHRFIEDEFKKSDIPSFVDYKRSVIKNPFIDAIMAALEMVEKDFSYESVFRFLKLGVTDISREDIDLVENYVFQSGRRGYKSYCAKWERKYKNIDEDRLEKINSIRERITEIFTDFRKALIEKGANATDYTKAVYKFILENNWQENIRKHQLECENSGLSDEAKEYEQIYGAIINLLEKIVEFIGDACISIREYRQIMQAGFESVKVGIVPPGLDTVMVGDLERTRLKDIKKIIFFAGVNDGLIPAASSGGGGIISDTEREILKSVDYTLAPTAKENIFKERFYLYSLFAKPTEKMYFSYSTSGNDGAVLRKSYVLSGIERMFPTLKEVKENYKNIVPGDITNASEAFECITYHLQQDRTLENNPQAKQVMASLLENEDREKIVHKMIQSAYYSSRKPKILPEVAKGLYGNRNNIGITRLEKYAACAYSQFLSNGLRLQERSRFEIAAYDIGNLYHYSIEMFCRKMKNLNLNWRTLMDEEREKLVEDCVNKVVEEYENNAISSDARNKYISDRVLKTTIKTTEILKRHIIAGEFEPTYYEMEVEHGKVDRVDLFENPEDGKIYVKVIDYKSGKKKFDISSVFFGIQMQLMIYLGDIVKREQKENGNKKVLPAGAFYYEVKDPYIEGLSAKEKKDLYADETVTKEELKNKVKEAIEQKRYKEYKMSGIFTDDMDILKGMDRNMKLSSDIIPVRKKKDDSYYADVMAMDDEHFSQFIEYVEEKAESFQREICAGNIEINPIETACTYCPYGSVCGFDINSGDKFRKVPRYKLLDIVEKLDELKEENHSELKDEKEN